MRHRIGGGLTGLGNPNPVILDNVGVLNEVFAKAALEQYFQEVGGFDYSVSTDCVSVGLEPAYQYEALKIISINREIGKSFLRTGKAFGPYGSGIRSRIRFFRDCKTRSKFKRFVEEWHEKLFPELAARELLA